MFVIGVDQSWLHTPFFLHRWTVKDEQEITTLKQSGIRQVTIDPERSDTPTGIAIDTQSPANDGTIPPNDPNGPNGPIVAPSQQDGWEVVNRVRTQAVRAVQRIFEGIATGVQIDAPALQTTVLQLIDSTTAHCSAMMRLVCLQQLERVDNNLYAHCVDVAVMALIVGIERGLPQADLEALATGALLHDVGKIRLPANLVRKGDGQTEAERTLLEFHPSLGIAALAQTEELPEPIFCIILEHHELLDGSGFPSHHVAEHIFPLAQIVGVVDLYDTLSTSRGGRPAFPPTQAVSQLYQLALQGKFDRSLVEQLIYCLGVYPIGSLVELNTGELAVVMALNPQSRMKPTVKIVQDQRGKRLESPRVLDLSHEDAPPLTRTIQRVLDPEQQQVAVSHYLEGS